MPGVDVATIKPNNSGLSGMQQLTINGRDFKTVNSSLSDLMQFAYNVQLKQIIGAPEWIDKDRYDIAGTPDQEGAPSVEQLRTMVRKLIAERFQLKFHHDKRELSFCSHSWKRWLKADADSVERSAARYGHEAGQ